MCASRRTAVLFVFVLGLGLYAQPTNPVVVLTLIKYLIRIHIGEGGLQAIYCHKKQQQGLQGR